MRGMLCVLAGAVLAVSASAEPKTVRVLAVGNSFSRNALHYFDDIVRASGNTAVSSNAYIGGCDFERHMRHADAFEADPADPQGRPYPGGKSLKDLLTAQRWDYVTIQQVSHKSYRIDTYHPSADRLIAYIRKYAPQASIVIHETWAYRDDHYWFLNRDKNPDRPAGHDAMYRGVRTAYDAFSKETGFRMIPCGDAMELARADPAWGPFVPDASFNPKTAVYPALPKDERHALQNGYNWRKNAKTGAYALGQDCIHANARGEYLQGCVWFEFFFGQSVVGNAFVPQGVTAEEASIFQRVAHRAVSEKQRPTVPAQ